MSSTHTIKIMKILVIVMTGLMAIGLAFLAYGLSINGPNMDDSSARVRGSGKVEGYADLRVPFGRLTLHQAPGTRITSMRVDSQCLILLLEGGAQGARVIVIDLVSGCVLGTVTVEFAK